MEFQFTIMFLINLNCLNFLDVSESNKFRIAPVSFSSICLPLRCMPLCEYCNFSWEIYLSQCGASTDTKSKVYWTMRCAWEKKRFLLSQEQTFVKIQGHLFHLFEEKAKFKMNILVDWRNAILSDNVFFDLYCKTHTEQKSQKSVIISN